MNPPGSPGALPFSSLIAAVNCRAHLGRVMSLHFRQERTATGRPELVATGECAWQEFPRRAWAVVEHFRMTVTRRIDGLDERLVAHIGDAQFCISWDIWSPEVSVMAWENTSDVEVERLAAHA